VTRRDARTRGSGETLPAQPGWYVQWCDRADWRPVSPDFAAWVVDQFIDGEKLVLITEQQEAAA
jgi:hypothetical protein